MLGMTQGIQINLTSLISHYSKLTSTACVGYKTVTLMNVLL